MLLVHSIFCRQPAYLKMIGIESFLPLVILKMLIYPNTTNVKCRIPKAIVRHLAKIEVIKPFLELLFFFVTVPLNQTIFSLELTCLYTCFVIL